MSDLPYYYDEHDNYDDDHEDACGYLAVEDVKVWNVSEKALMVTANKGEAVWIPRSQVKMGDKVQCGWFPALLIQSWLVKKHPSWIEGR